MTALLYEIIYVWVAAAGLLSFFLPKAGIEEPGLSAVVITVLISALVPVLKRSGWTVRLIIFGILTALFVAGVFMLRNDAIREFLYGYKAYTWLPLIALGAVIAGELLVYIRPLKVIVSIFLIAYMILAAVKSFPVDKLMLLCASAMIIITVIEEMQLRWNKAGDTDHKSHLVYVSGFVIATLILILICPAPEEPYDWQFVKNIANSAYELMLDIQRKLTPSGLYDPTVSSIGFSGRGEILGNIAHQNDEVMQLCDLPSGTGAIRISGKTFDTFDGREWYSTDPSERDDDILDTLAFLASASEFTDVRTDLAQRTTFRVEYSALRSEYVFIPLKSLIGPDGTDGKAIEFTGGDMLWESDELPEQYYLTCYRLNTGNPLFTDFLKNASIPSEEAYDYQISDTSMTGQPGISYTDYLEYVKRVEELYTEAPVLSPELRSYMDEVFEGCEDDVDKIARLCSLLRSFEYTTSPGNLPDEVTDASSMLDYFMLESRRGYCIHFSTAFVLLARAEGIPARLAQGYNVPVSNERNAVVYTYMAHSWPEVYIEGAGWIACEPTPGYSLGSYWRTEEENREAYGNLSSGYTGYLGEEEIQLPIEEPAEELEETEKTHIPWYVIVIPVVSGILVVALFIAGGNLIVTFVFARKDTEEKYKVLCRQIMDLLAVLELGTKPGETLKEYGERIGADAGDEIGAFIGNLTLYLYAGGSDISAYEKQAYSYRSALLGRIRKERFMRYLIYYLSFQKVKTPKSVANA